MKPVMPLCFESQEQWDLYVEACVLCKHPENHFCDDCTPKYQAKMLLMKRCTHPECIFNTKPNSSSIEKEKMNGAIPFPRETPEKFIERIRRLARSGYLIEPESVVHRKLTKFLKSEMA